MSKFFTKKVSGEIRSLAFFMVAGVAVSLMLKGVKAEELPIVVPKPDTPVVSVKKVAITFDDGPYGAPTEKILDILKSKGIHATFFLIGKNVEKYPQIAKRIVDEGNMVGNHTYDHPQDLTLRSVKDVVGELSRAEDQIFIATGVRATLFRAPYGRLNDNLRKEIKSYGYTIVTWNVDPKDWDYSHSPSASIVRSVILNESDRMVILLHDGRDSHIDYPRDNTVNALPALIDNLKNQGYTFVTADEIVK
jgi:peptidoglycan/xylan/chitin deacetylase (PgdA/CDA1 family)